MKTLLAFGLVFSSSFTWALPKASFNALNPELLESRNLKASKDYDFEGIVKLSNCSGALVIFHGQPMTSKAVVMTNGHCIQKTGGYLNHGETLVDRPVSREMKLFDRSMKLFTIRATKILYATMTDTDLAFYELDKSYLEIMQTTFIRPFILDSLRPSIGQRIEIISGYWDRGYRCEIDNFIFRLQEGSWTWKDSIRYTAGCDTIGGTSGSPIIARGEKKVVGVNNTSNESGQRCTLNNPCEVNESGVVFAQQGIRYGQQTYNIYPCLTVDFRINPEQPLCDLPK